MLSHKNRFGRSFDRELGWKLWPDFENTTLDWNRCIAREKSNPIEILLFSTLINSFFQMNS